MKRFNPSTFTTNTNWWWDLWGGGHTPDTIPTSRGWRVRALKKGSHVVLVGRPGVEGCFSAIFVRQSRHPDGFLIGKSYIDVAIYAETPEEVANRLNGGNAIDCPYHQLDTCPGWGLEAIRLVEADQAELAKYR